MPHDKPATICTTFAPMSVCLLFTRQSSHQPILPPACIHFCQQVSLSVQPPVSLSIHLSVCFFSHQDCPSLSAFHFLAFDVLQHKEVHRRWVSRPDLQQSSTTPARSVQKDTAHRDKGQTVATPPNNCSHSFGQNKRAHLAGSVQCGKQTAPKMIS